MESNMILGLLVIGAVGLFMYSQGHTKTSPDCEVDHANADCVCYDNLVKVQKDIQCITVPCNPQYDCIKPQCVDADDCGDLTHIACEGRWECMENKCNWLCINI